MLIHSVSRSLCQTCVMSPGSGEVKFGKFTTQPIVSNIKVWKLNSHQTLIVNSTCTIIKVFLLCVFPTRKITQIAVCILTTGANTARVGTWPHVSSANKSLLNVPPVVIPSVEICNCENLSRMCNELCHVPSYTFCRD